METFARVLLAAAVGLALVGGVLLVLSKLGIGRLPGDLLVRRGHFTFYAPFGLMLLLSVLLTIFLNLFFRR